MRSDKQLHRAVVTHGFEMHNILYFQMQNYYVHVCVCVYVWAQRNIGVYCNYTGRMPVQNNSRGKIKKKSIADVIVQITTLPLSWESKATELSIAHVSLSKDNKRILN